MKSVIRSALAAAAAGVALAGCATYDYGYGYSYPQPYNGYSYGYGPSSYDYGPYYGPPVYVAPSIGLGFAYRDYDRGDYDRNYNWRRDSSDRYDHGYRRDNDQWRGDHDRSHSAAPLPSGRDDPWGGTNIPFGRNSQQ